jgi:hypothetical protein
VAVEVLFKNGILFWKYIFQVLYSYLLLLRINFKYFLKLQLCQWRVVSSGMWLCVFLEEHTISFLRLFFMVWHPWRWYCLRSPPWGPWTWLKMCQCRLIAFQCVLILLLWQRDAIATLAMATAVVGAITTAAVSPMAQPQLHLLMGAAGGCAKWRSHRGCR